MTITVFYTKSHKKVFLNYYFVSKHNKVGTILCSVKPSTFFFFVLKGGYIMLSACFENAIYKSNFLKIRVVFDEKIIKILMENGFLLWLKHNICSMMGF